MNHIKIEAKEFKPTVLIFTRSGWTDFYECYTEYVCKKCGSFDWLAAIQSGLHTPPVLPSRMPDVFWSSDFRSIIVSRNFKKAVESYSENLACFIPIPGQKDYYVFLPNDLIMPPTKVRISSGYDFKGEPYMADKPPCKTCGHYSNLCFNRALFYVPDDVVLCGIVIDKKSMAIAASKELAEHLSKANLSGLSINKKGFSQIPNNCLINRTSIFRQVIKNGKSPKNTKHQQANGANKVSKKTVKKQSSAAKLYIATNNKDDFLIIPGVMATKLTKYYWVAINQGFLGDLKDWGQPPRPIKMPDFTDKTPVKEVTDYIKSTFGKIIAEREGGLADKGFVILDKTKWKSICDRRGVPDF